MFRHPMMEWFGQFHEPSRALLQAFKPHGFGLESLQVMTGAQLVNQQGVQMLFGVQGTYTWRLDRSEAVFWNLNFPAMLHAVKVIRAADEQLRQTSPEWGIESHQFSYSAHGVLETGSVADLLGQFKIPTPTSGGTHAHTAPIFYWKVPEKGWETQLNIDKSQIMSGGLFLSFSLSIRKDRIEFEEVFGQAHEYLTGILQEFGVQLPSEE